MTDKDKTTALKAVNIIKKKQCGKIKGKTCTKRSKQRDHISKDDDFFSPIASLGSILMKLIINVWEEREVAVANIPGAYLKKEFPARKIVTLKLRAYFVDIMCSLNSKYL